MSSNLNKKILILIPALNPGKEFEEYVDLLIENNLSDILVINDGSESTYDDIFSKVADKKGCTVLTHDKNRGKGAAIKTGLKYFLELPSIDEFTGVITADCDGQHLVKDIKAIVAAMQDNLNNLILGSRDFSQENVPPKSSFGNKATSNVIKLLYGVKISDTQTGLRGIPKTLVKRQMNLSGERYEYETNVLIDCIVNKVDITEIPIETVYIDNNSNTHFRPIHDSISIYWRILNSFIKYSLSSLISCVIDILFFKIFLMILGFDNESTLIIVSTVFARIISSCINFLLNRKFAFDSKKKVKNTIIKYYILCIVQMFVSGTMVALIHSLTNISEVPIKLLIDIILFVINFRIQRMFIFNK